MKSVKALSIAGFDPSGWAGVIADACVFRDFGVIGFSAAAALTAQDLKKVRAVVPVEPGLLARQIKTLLDGSQIEALKIGMLATKGNVCTVARLIKKRKIQKVVLDTVLRSSGGYPLLEKTGVLSLVKELIPLATIVTPNIDEASVITGIKIKGLAGMEEAARKIYALGPSSVLVKGGHLDGSPVDVLYDGKVFYYYRGRRLRGPEEAFHGTGCILSSAVAAGLARGRTIKRAVTDAKKYTEKVLKERARILK